MKLYLANTDFEFELINPKAVSLKKGMAFRGLTLQLFFLPILFSSPQEAILVYGKPPETYIKNLLKMGILEEHELPVFADINEIGNFDFDEISSWGASQRLKRWASEKGLNYSIPDWETVCEVNSKEFTHRHCPSLPQASLLYSSTEVEEWIQATPGEKVLKSCFGIAGRGHIRIDAANKYSEDLDFFLQKEFSKSLPVVGEPWVERLLDFSTQWEILPDKTVSFIGTTGLINTLSGEYIGTIVDTEENLLGPYYSFLQRHKEEGERLLKLAAEKGYFGFAGLDALIYCDKHGQILLYPIVELNARMTMGLAALRFQKQYLADKTLKLVYGRLGSQDVSMLPLLPESIWIKGEERTFQRQLYCQINDRT